jgi:hypothetical protein
VNPDPDLRAHARAHGWPIRDFRTGRKIARIGIPAAGGAGMITGAVVAGIALRRRAPLARGPRPAGWRRLGRMASAVGAPGSSDAR